MTTKQLLLIPGPVQVAPAVLAASAQPMIDHRGPEFAGLLRALSKRVGRIFGTASDVYVLGSSGSGALEAAVVNAFSPGDKVLACPVGVFGYRIAEIAKTYGCDVELLETPPGQALDPAALAARLATDGGGAIAGVLLTQNETSTGVQNDMAALAAAIGAHPATVIVDAVSGMGATPFHMDEWHFDIVVSASQKVLAAPPGVAFAAVSARAWERIERARIPRFYLDLRKARDFYKLEQTPWTPPVSVVFALAAALDLYEEETAPNVHARHARYALAIRAAAEALGLTIFSQAGAHSPTVVAIEVPPGVTASAVQKTARERAGVVISGGQKDLKGKIWRIGTMGDVSQTDILHALGALEVALLENGYRTNMGAAIRTALAIFLQPAITPGDAQRAAEQKVLQTTVASP